MEKTTTSADSKTLSSKGSFELRDIFQGDPVLWAVVFALSMIGILLVYSATGTLAFRYMEGDTETYLLRHTSIVLVGFIAMWFCSRIDYRVYSRLSRFALLLSVPLLLFTWRYGVTINDATRWITIPYFNRTFQPADLAKFALIVNVASMLAKRQNAIRVDAQRAFTPILIWCGIICGLIGLSDLSGAVLLFVTCMLLMFIGRVPSRYLLNLLAVGLIAGLFAVVVGQRGETAKNRLKAFFDLEQMPFQAEQAHIAIATGGFIGKGPGQSVQRDYIPHPYSDFIFAILIEEYGFVGAAVVIALYLTLLYRGMLVAAKSELAFGGLLSAGLSFSLVIQAFVNMGVAVGILPITGLPLPLISMGGTSMLFTGVSIGVIISVSRGIRTIRPLEVRQARLKLT
ncbi:MAG: FtsW/RodA/SpoVE family cell cycle protein [Cytophagales bacterium]|nr:FtsW/RodA/SpoVE family cell cycle protein [Bernardetiaceae bacterium]MDW8211674.1 FtsW/RodA/SpoVE family cell cycle protein [Cytophagales bacterium]